MFSKLAKIMLMCTSIAPVGVTYAWVAYQEGFKWTAVILLAVCAVLAFLSVGLLRYGQKNLSETEFKITSIEPSDSENIAFMLLYLLPLFESNFAGLNWQVWIPAIVIFAAVIGSGYGYHFNPMLGLLGWHFYKVGTEEGVSYLLISKNEFCRTATPIMVGSLTEYIVLDMGGKNG